jgi:hypothetical protein
MDQSTPRRLCLCIDEKKIQSLIRPVLSGGGSGAIGLGVAAHGGHGMTTASRPIPAADSNQGGVLDGDLGTVERIQGRAEGVQGRGRRHTEAKARQSIVLLCFFKSWHLWLHAEDDNREFKLIGGAPSL